MKLHERINMWMMRNVAYRPPDFIVGGLDNPYLYRWYLTPWSRYDRRNPPLWANITKHILPNAYLHLFKRSDDDRALHDHPWFNFSFLLHGTYIEESIAKGGIKVRVLRKAGDWKLRSPWAAHRVELNDGFCWTLFCTGPRVREWGFHCPDAGWVQWQNFVSGTEDGNNIGKGCNQ